MAHTHRHRATRSFVLILLVLLAAAAGFCGYVGYFGGPLHKLLPATSVPSPSERGMVAVYFSGDMGFNMGMGPRIAGRIAAQGIPVVGVNSLTAFARRRTPEQVVALVHDAVEAALRLPGAQRVAVIGQSFGANALLYGIGGLPAALRSKVAVVEFVVPSETMLLHATPGGVFDTRHDGPALPFARRLDWVPVLCLHGQTEPQSLCTIWTQPNVTRVTLPGDHFLNRDSALVAANLLRGIALHATGS